MNKKAQVAGKVAFENGKPCTPALDKACMGLIENSVNGQALSIMDAWISGWTKANLNAPITEVK